MPGTKGRGRPVASEYNDRQICFICCRNDREQFCRCRNYINELDVPSGFDIEVIPIDGAPSMAAGYNVGMSQSNAKYKVYLHQDVYITNRRMLRDMIDLFATHPQIGLLGVVGAQVLPATGIWWESSSCYGKVNEVRDSERRLQFNEVREPYMNVEALDGLILMTQYDVSWREDLFPTWHFYDISQCQEFLRAGFEVAIPKQEEPWCIHNCGSDINLNGYEESRQVFLHEYLRDRTQSN